MATAGFSIRLDTARTGIAEKLAAFKASPDVVVKEMRDKAGKIVREASVTPADQTQIELAKKTIQDRVEALPEKFDGVLIIASGQQDMETGRSILDLQVYGKIGHQ